MNTYGKIKHHLRTYKPNGIGSTFQLAKHHETDPYNFGRRIKETIARLDKFLRPAGLKITVEEIKKKANENTKSNNT